MFFKHFDKVAGAWDQGRKKVEDLVHHGFGAARKAHSFAYRAGEAIDKGITAIDDVTGGALSAKFGKHVDNFRRRLAKVRKADKLINRAEGAVDKVRKKVDVTETLVKRGIKRGRELASEGKDIAGETGSLIKRTRTLARALDG